MFQWDAYTAQEPENKTWDVVVIGAGMGGCTIGWALAKHNLSVLFLERGHPARLFTWQRNRSGIRRFFRSEKITDADLEARGSWPKRIAFERRGKRVVAQLALGTGPGGSTVIYGAALERLRRADFARTDHSLAGDQPMPDEWPVEYDTFVKYYEQAERLFGVRGSRDPTDPDDTSVLDLPPALSQRDYHFFQSFKQAGLSPYRLHVGIEYTPGCTECLGLPCPNDCKADASSRALRPSLRNYGAKILLGCEVLRLETSRHHVKHVVARVGSRELNIRGRIMILAAGALSTPQILLKSACERWPNGLGNDSGLVGRCLMFHISEFVALWPTVRLDASGPKKTLSSRALYTVAGKKFGGFQSVGLPISYGHIYGYLLGWYERHFRWRVPIARRGLMVAAIVAAWLFRDAALFATIMEDFPYRDNRVEMDPNSQNGFKIVYEHSEELISRISLMRRLLRARLGRHRPFFLTGTDNLNFGHPSGTCRFGSDPATSVLTPNNQVIGISNLYVVDASFFPSCGGANPSLTVAANALRVAELILERIPALQAAG